MGAQLAGNRDEAVRVVLDGMAGGASVQELQLSVIQEAQREIGRLWQDNRISVAQEHMATAISHMVLARLYDEASREPANGMVVLVACVQGELHDFPARLIADALDLAGFDVRYLGADVPADTLLERVAEIQPDMVALSATMDFNMPALRDAVQRVRALTRDRRPIMIGGAACTASVGVIDELGVAGTGLDAAEMVQRARKLLGLEL
jgi:methanogenic corrinoid protein MtbC1